MQEKPEFKQGSRRLDTLWLGDNISISLGDFACLGTGGFQVAEFKRDTPFLPKVQLELFKRDILHIVVHFGDFGLKAKNPAKWFEIYCPKGDNWFEWNDGRGYLLRSRTTFTLTRDQVKPVLRGDQPWPCCGRFSIDR